MKKFVIGIAVLLVAFIPTYILIFQAVKTSVATPDVYYDGKILEPALMGWVTMDNEGNKKATLQNNFFNIKESQFEKAEHIRLEELSDVADITYAQQPALVTVQLYDMTVNYNDPNDPQQPITTTPEEIAKGGVTGYENPTQIILRVEWDISPYLRTYVGYSLEVYP